MTVSWVYQTIFVELFGLKSLVYIKLRNYNNVMVIINKYGWSSKFVITELNCTLNLVFLMQ